MTQTPSEADSADRRRSLRRILLILGVFFVFVQINRSGGGVLASYLGSERGLSPTDIGTVMGAMFFGSAAAQLPTGILFDRIGPTRTLMVLGLIALAGILLFALASDPWVLVAGRVAIGVGHGGVITAVYLIAMGWAPPDRVGQATAGLVGIAGGIGGVLATTPLALALERVGLQGSFLVLAVMTALLMLVIHLLVRDGPDSRDADDQGPKETLAQSVAGLVEVMRMPELRRIFIMGVCFTAPFMTIGGLWAGPYFAQVQHLSHTEASVALLLLVIALHVGTYGYGVLDRIATSRRRVVLTGVAIEVVCLGVLAAWPTAPLPVAGVLLFVFSCAAPLFVILAAHARRFVPQRRAGRAITCISLMGLTGVFVLQTGTGAVIDMVAATGGAPETGFRLVFATVIAVLVVTAGIYAGQPEGPKAPG
ncbi:MFS transporter [Thalassobaculum fulvum]|uniref:MFS transporter n=1 Tax=Thalassobaculum fulvum TaxID=1633335 RepID=A0A919CQ67_9PROT|nr:MFS transporter [Thalassobaculum fulvum]GHD53386.1 MFS transporter [Thalassobaculum fulvum]